MSRVIGLTGGIGSGKSAAALRFAALGAAVIDVDDIAHALTGPEGAAMAAIRANFGEEVVCADGSLDRTAMRARAFAHPQERRQLEGILHPMIRAESDALVRTASQSGAPYVVLVVPLLVETGGYAERCDRVAVVDCPEDVQIERVVARNGLSVEQVRSIMAAQVSRTTRLAAADDVIDNSSDLAALQQQINRLDCLYRSQD